MRPPLTSLRQAVDLIPAPLWRQNASPSQEADLSRTSTLPVSVVWRAAGTSGHSSSEAWRWQGVLDGPARGINFGRRCCCMWKTRLWVLDVHRPSSIEERDSRDTHLGRHPSTRSRKCRRTSYVRERHIFVSPNSVIALLGAGKVSRTGTAWSACYWHSVRRARVGAGKDGNDAERG